MKGRPSWHQACLHPDRYSFSTKMQGAGGQALASLPQHAVAWSHPNGAFSQPSSQPSSAPL